jgi:hypothetical protein
MNRSIFFDRNVARRHRVGANTSVSRVGLRGGKETVVDQIVRHLDRKLARSFNHDSSGVPVTLAGQEGIRCVSPLQWRHCGCVTMPELPPQLSAVSSSPRYHWALPCKAREGGEERRPASQETCLSESSFRRAGRANGADFR